MCGGLRSTGPASAASRVVRRAPLVVEVDHQSCNTTAGLPRHLSPTSHRTGERSSAAARQSNATPPARLDLDVLRNPPSVRRPAHLRLISEATWCTRAAILASALTRYADATTSWRMSHPRVLVPRIGVSLEGTREFFGLSESDAARALRLADRAFEQSQVPATSNGRVKRKAAAKSATAIVRKVHGG